MVELRNLGDWTGPRIAQQCEAEYARYRAAKTESYRAYFAANPHLKADDHAYKAADLAAALPEEWAEVATLLPESERHRHYLSGNSSQILGLALFGVAGRLDPSHDWLWNALAPIPPRESVPTAQFEKRLDPETLDEQPRQTSIDYFVEDRPSLICVECKWTEAGMGTCGCGLDAAAGGDCSDRVLSRTAYWETARDVFRLPDRQEGKPCPLSFTYQAVRNVAAACALARPGQEPVFALIYDAENPYFAGIGDWPGWPATLGATLDDSPVRFRSVSWQELLPLLPLDASARAWAAEKHGLNA
ncbi:hypothetical protein AYO39_00565 [Actinobacteria bacterium SCGC AG-212-D09]|nr:hypothetical protein AYO39_00565 [Actinobacteria bacterium SCGC AG-212-D09]